MKKQTIKGIISSPFGTRRDPLTPSTWRVHNGIDIAAPIGTPIYSPINGEVVATYFHAKGGKTIILKDSDNEIRLGFCHLQKMLVEPNTTIKQGQRIALSGNTGAATTGAHLHFSLKTGGQWIGDDYTDGQWQNPAAYLTF